MARYGNAHTAEQILANSQNLGSYDAMEARANLAQAHATLATVDELRIANLIAFQNHQMAALEQVADGVKMLAEEAEDFDDVAETLAALQEQAELANVRIGKVAAEIRERLGLA